MTLATLSPNLRMIVFQFLVNKDQVPSTIPLRQSTGASTLTPVSGVEVLPSTPKLNLLHLLDGICHYEGQGSYELIDAWFEYTERPDDKRKVRFVFCERIHVRNESLHTEFLAKRNKLVESLVNMLTDNLWATRGHINPYLLKDGSQTRHTVLMLDCAGRVSTVNPDGSSVKVWSGGRDPQTKRGVGELIPLITACKRICVDETNGSIVLADAQNHQFISASISA